MARKDPKPFEVKPWKPGSTVTVDGADYVVWSDGPKPASVWTQSDDGRMVAIKLPTASRPALILTDDPRKPLAHAEAVRSVAFLVRDTFRAYSAYDRKHYDRYEERVHVLAECSEAVKSFTLARPVQKATERVELSAGRRHYLATLTLKGEQPSSGATLCFCIRNHDAR